MTPNELKRICTAHGYTATYVASGTRNKPRWQATSHDHTRKTIYLCQGHALDTLTEDEVRDKLSQHQVSPPKLCITRLPGDKLELRRGKQRSKGTTAIVLGRAEIEELRWYLNEDGEE
jgi:hypothetical protein